MKKIVIVILLAALAAFALADANQPQPSGKAARAAKSAEVPAGLSDHEAEIWRLGFAAGFDAGIFADQDEQDYILNRNSKKFHWPGCEGVANMKPENRVEFHGTRDAILSMGYVPCKICMP